MSQGYYELGIPNRIAPYRKVSSLFKFKHFCKTFSRHNLYASVYAFRTFKGDPTLGGKENSPDYDSAVVNVVFFEFEEEGAKELTENVRKEVLDFVSETEEWELRPHIFFSGRRGFHILFYFNEVKLKRANAVIKRVPGTFEREFDLQHMCPVARHGTRQMRRIPNTLHQGSKLYCIPISLQEMREFSVEEIQELAKEPRKDFYLEKEYYNNPLIEDLLISIDEEIAKWIAKNKNKKLMLTKGELSNLPDCPAYKEALNGVNVGVRNEVMVGLISYLKNVKKLPKRQVLWALLSWRKKCENPESFPQKEIYSCLAYHYNESNKHIGCGMFRKAGLCKVDNCEIREVKEWI